ncbi:MAG: DNA polymerase IV, partial [Candidatus Magasanikbacteria bacterium]|nr:DNA polymerase IV [Candidatus Magasanikbacteria bacterium]
FTPPSRDSEFIFSQLSKNIENACIKLRRYHQATPSAHFILRTQDFHHTSLEIVLERPTNLPSEIIPRARAAFEKMVVKNRWYRATGVVFFNLVPMVIQDDLFGAAEKLKRLQALYKGADAVAKKFGKHSLFLGTSWQANKFKNHLTERGDEPERKNILFLGETNRKRLAIPLLIGVVV